MTAPAPAAPGRPMRKAGGEVARRSQRSASRRQPYKVPRESQLSLEDHGGHIPEGVGARVCQRVLSLAAGVWHSWLLWEAGHIDAPGRHFTSYDH